VQSIGAASVFAVIPSQFGGVALSSLADWTA